MMLVFFHSTRLKNFIDFCLILGTFLLAKSATSTDVGSSNRGEQDSYTENGYDCGKLFITDEMVSDALRIALSDMGVNIVRPYIGPLYKIHMNYLTWPIVSNMPKFVNGKVPSTRLWRKSIYQVVFSSQGEVIDVIVRISNNDFAKCWRVDHSQPKSKGQDLETPKGYYCGSRFIPNEHLKKSASYAQKYLGQNKRFPAPYIGHLYDKNLGYMVWPIYTGSNFFTSPDRQKGPYLIVIDPKGQLKDVIVKAFGDDFVKCMISNIDPPAFASNEQSEVNTRTSRSGFDCKGIFFDDNDLQLASDMARRSRATGRNVVYPVEYDGPLFDSPCLLWPIKPSRSTVRAGSLSNYRLILTLDYKIMCVAIQSYNTLKKCERKTIIGGGLNHDQNDYKCHNKIFSNKELISAAEAACKERTSFTKSYPRSYEGATFDVPGPYLIYPIVKGKKFHSNPGLNYVVINYECVLAGVLTIDKTTKELRRCETIRYISRKDMIRQRQKSIVLEPSSSGRK